jgi:hypothetical protein
MAAAIDRVELLDSRYQEAAACVVCGSEISAGEGLTASYRGRTARLKCAGCLERFEVEPMRYSTGHPNGCCQADRGQSPASEWTCD